MQMPSDVDLLSHVKHNRSVVVRQRNGFVIALSYFLWEKLYLFLVGNSRIYLYNVFGNSKCFCRAYMTISTTPSQPMFCCVAVQLTKFISNKTYSMIVNKFLTNSRSGILIFDMFWSRGAKTLLEFEIWYFPIQFFAKKVALLSVVIG